MPTLSHWEYKEEPQVLIWLKMKDFQILQITTVTLWDQNQIHKTM
jgi:hypothetical protein